MTRKLFPARFIIQLALCHPTRALIYLTRLDTRLELKYNSFCTPARVAIHFVIFKPLSYCFEDTIGFGVKASLASRPLPRLIR